HGPAVLSVCFSPDGQRVASADMGGSVLVWETNTGKILASRKIPGEAKPDPRLEIPLKLSVVFAPDGKRLALSGPNKSVRIWDPVSGKDVFFQGPAPPVQGVAFPPSGKRLAAGGADGSLRIWEVDSGKQLLTLHGHFENPDEADEPPGRPPRRRASAVLAVAFSP